MVATAVLLTRKGHETERQVTAPRVETAVPEPLVSEEIVNDTDKTNSFAFGLMATFMRVEVNGQEILRQPHGLTPAKMPAAEFQVSLGAMKEKAPSTSPDAHRYRKLRS